MYFMMHHQYQTIETGPASQGYELFYNKLIEGFTTHVVKIFNKACN